MNPPLQGAAPATITVARVASMSGIASRTAPRATLTIRNPEESTKAQLRQGGDWIVISLVISLVRLAKSSGRLRPTPTSGIAACWFGCPVQDGGDHLMTPL
jgi:hypothetical protein